MACMRHALDDPTVPGDLREPLLKAFAQTADHMRNRPDQHHEPAFGIIEPRR
jgi:truncated hemoglobin YjbI